jgi:hypothetical protein
MKYESRNSLTLADQKGYSAVICMLNSYISTDEKLYGYSSYMGYVYSNLGIIMTSKWNVKCTKCSLCTVGWVLWKGQLLGHCLRCVTYIFHYLTDILQCLIGYNIKQ